MKKAKFQSYTFLKDYVEETEDGKLVEHDVFLQDNGEIEATILEERKYTFKLQLADGKVIIKKKSQVELV